MDSFTDIPENSWAGKMLPNAALPYLRLARLDRPTGWWLLLLPCWWSLSLAPAGQATARLFVLFLVGAIAMRGAGCTLNDIIDRNIDAQVERTRHRPLPSGQVSLVGALVWMLVLLIIGAGVLFSLNRRTIGLGVLILFVVASYPFMKRVTFWPQIFLGLSFNWGALMASTAATGAISMAAVLLYLGGIAWTLGYDTIYAHQDKKYDEAAGVKSTALQFGRSSKQWIAGFYLAAIFCVGLALFLLDAGMPAYFFLGLAALHFVWQIIWWMPDDPADCLRRFQSNRDAGWLVLASCLASHI